MGSLFHGFLEVLFYGVMHDWKACKLHMTQVLCKFVIQQRADHSRQFPYVLYFILTWDMYSSPVSCLCGRAYCYCIFGGSVHSRWSIHHVVSLRWFLRRWMSNRLQNGVYEYADIVVGFDVPCVWCKVVMMFHCWDVCARFLWMLIDFHAS
jgi:hypothetical protein